MEKSMQGATVVNKFNDAVPIKKNKISRILDKDGETMKARAAQKGRWEAEWESHREEWVSKTKCEFPTFQSEQEVWSKATLTDAAQLIWWLQHSSAPHHVLNHLREPVLADLTQGYREEVIAHCLGVLKSSTPDPEVKEWLQSWSRRTSGAATPALRAVLLNAKDDWAALKAINYGDIPVLKLCTANNRAEFSRYILCAMVYQDEIATLIDQDPLQQPTPRDYVERLLSALSSSKNLRQAFKSGKDSGEWSALSVFFSTLHNEDEEMEASQY